MTGREIGLSIKNAGLIFSRNVWKILLFDILVYIPLAFIQYLIPDIDLSGMTETELTQNTDKLMIYVLSIVLLSLFASFFTLAMMRLAFVSYDAGSLKGQFEISDGLDYSVRKFPKYLLTVLIMGAIIGLGFAFFVIPGLLFAIILSYTVYIAAVTDEWGFKALKKSTMLVRKNSLKAILIMACEAVCIGTVSSTATTVLEISEQIFSWDKITYTIADGIANVLVAPVSAFCTIFMVLVTVNFLSSLPEKDTDRAQVR